jgi:hypothetical protein
VPAEGGREADAGRLRALRDGYAEQATPVRQRQAEALGLERRLADLVNQAYGLTPEDVELLWRTAPPRMPVGKGTMSLPCSIGTKSLPTRQTCRLSHIRDFYNFTQRSRERVHP